MEYRAVSKNVKMSPRKLRLIADSIRTVSLSVALSQLMGSNKRASLPLAKTINSAIANAVNTHNGDKNNLVIKELVIQEGAVYKRYHYAARGRARPYKKKTSHIRVILADKVEKKTEPSLVKPEVKEKLENMKELKEKKGKEKAVKSATK